jgi:hypothetical protein
MLEFCCLLLFANLSETSHNHVDDGAYRRSNEANYLEESICNIFSIQIMYAGRKGEDAKAMRSERFERKLSKRSTGNNSTSSRKGDGITKVLPE